MPGPVKEDKKSFATLLGNIENRLYLSESKGLICEAACADVPVPPGQEDAFFTNFVQFMFTARNVTVRSEKKITLGTSPGREWEVETKGIAGRSRAYLINGKYYALS